MASRNVLSVDTEKLKYTIQDGFSTEGNKVSIELILPYSSLETVRNIKNCGQCPVGYMGQGCGRMLELQSNGVPSTCRLKRKHLSDLLRLLADSLDVASMTKE